MCSTATEFILFSSFANLHWNLKRSGYAVNIGIPSVNDFVIGRRQLLFRTLESDTVEVQWKVKPAMQHRRYPAIPLLHMP